MLRTSAPLIGALGDMGNRRSVFILLTLAGASTVSLAAMVHGAGKFEWHPMYAWVLGPYAVLSGISLVPGHQSDARQLATCITAAILFIATCWSYIGAFWFSASSTAALIFLFAPIWMLCGSLIVWPVAWFGVTQYERAKRRGPKTEVA